MKSAIRLASYYEKLIPMLTLSPKNSYNILTVPYKTISYLILSIYLLCPIYGIAKNETHSIERVEGAAYEWPILRTSLSCESELGEFLKTILPPDIEPLYQKRLEILLNTYALLITLVEPPAYYVDILVEDQMRAWHQAGMTKEAVQKEVNAHSMEEVRTKLKEKITHQLQTRLFLERIIEPILSGPEQVRLFYALHLKEKLPLYPAQLTLLELVYYPDEKDFNHAMTLLKKLYQQLIAIKKSKKRIALFMKILKKHAFVSPYPATYGYLYNSANIALLTLEELPYEIEEQCLAIGATSFFPGLLIPPHACRDAYGRKGIRLVLVKQFIPSHIPDITSDYHYITNLFLQDQARRQLLEWFTSHAEETKSYG